MFHTFFAREEGQAVLEYTILVGIVGFITAQILSVVSHHIVALCTQIVVALG